MREYALVLGVAMLVTFVVTGLVRHLAVKVHAFTPIRARDVHTRPTPRLGGLGVYLGVTVALVLASQLPQLHQAFASSSQLLGVVIAGGVICAVGALDDRFDLDAVTKLAAQVLAAAIMVFFGVQWIVMWLPTGDGIHGTTVTLDRAQSTLVTVLITLVLINAMNFIDGLDGLLAGVAAIAGIGMFVFSAHVLEVSANDSAASQAPLLAVAVVGACLGFLPHNFYRARIFMGDAGSMFIGMAMAAGIVEVGGTISPSTYGARTTVAALAPLIVALAVVFIPALDFLLAVVRRTKEGRHPFSADQRHLHHRMLALGHSHEQAVLVFYIWAVVISGSAVALAFTEWEMVIWPAAGGLLVAVGATFWPRVRRHLRVASGAAKERV
ncbi:MAG: undecaprenyl-phosphate alpha-N-acetylglucosaminyl 1-phosphate transferase [Actinobacteria bacterium 69-20]|jgi:UDP-GlcNAc:undecaprenyl-phosphate GlcNAc-1-phosphate transferase|nr:undecaprenyl/decaprenyl-phosphate alpha-N-acetylglucosaminyl 1-phosphate transferase [Actinomycetota bacterium]OJV30209.1 MAG: undecaprenyl-phosphate alpha-N-acetylglucosaminyl 1-phosphate transferase [Actinobacteria bacterium 69-20]